VLFKYLNPDRVDILESGLIRFTQPADFNDPFEFKPIVSTVASKAEMDELIDRDITRLVKAKLEEYSPQIRNLLPPEQLELVTRQLYSQYWPLIENKLAEIGSSVSQIFNDKSNELIGVLSLTEKSDNLLMWSHYAHSHKGFCIGFDNKSNFFNRRRSAKDEFYYLRKVEYSEQRPISRLTQLSGIELLLVKSNAWQYEQEWRMCAVLSDSSRIIEANPLPIHLFEFPKKAVTEVIFGACMDQKSKDNLLGILKNNIEYAHVIVKQAVISSQKFEIEFVEL
jgi:hypothetical protein